MKCVTLGPILLPKSTQMYIFLYFVTGIHQLFTDFVDFGVDVENACKDAG